MTDGFFTFRHGWWQSEEGLLEVLRIYKTVKASVKASRSAGVNIGTKQVYSKCSDFGIELRAGSEGGLAELLKDKGTAPIPPKIAPTNVTEPVPFPEKLHKLLLSPKFRNRALSVTELADEMEVAPKTIRAAVDVLRNAGIRLPEEEGDGIRIATLAPTKAKTFRSPFQGTHLRFGVVSDTHLSSNEEALEELEAAYDVFEEQGITQVYHPGDWTCGAGIYRTQAAEIKNHTFETQVAYLEKNYPRRDGIKTSGITGNHDIEGDFGRIGANPVQALANRRPDIEFLGDYHAWINLHTEAAPCWLYLLHGKGGMSYAYSYKAQKLVDGFPEDRRPDIMAVGHWHVHGNFSPRGTQVLFPGCFEWRSAFMERLGLQPAVGYHIVDMHIDEYTGKIVRWAPEWFAFHERPVTRIIFSDT